MSFSILVKMRKQNAVYWECTGYDKFDKPIYATPVEIKVRWVDVSEEFITATGKKVISRAKVYTGIDVVLDSVLWLGVLSDIKLDKSPFVNKAAWQVMRFDKLPTLRANKFLRTAYL